TTPQSRAGAADQGLPADRTDRARRRLKYGHREPRFASMLPGVGRTQEAPPGPPTELYRTLAVVREEPRKPRQAAPSALDPRARAQCGAWGRQGGKIRAKQLKDQAQERREKPPQSMRPRRSQTRQASM